MTWPLAATLIMVWALAVIFFRANRVWLPYYLLGSVGLALIVIFLGRATPVQEFMETGVSLATFGVANAVGIPARIFENDANSLMIFVIGHIVGNDQGWTMVRVTIECSSLLETGVISGMVGFYPGWTLKRRIGLVLIGTVATYLANIVRMTVIIGTLHLFGKDSLFIAHTIVGRAIFFVLVIAIFWYIITLPTMRSVFNKLQRDLAA